MKNTVIFLAGLVLIGWLNWNSPLLTHSPNELVLAMVMTALCVWPVLLWLRRGMKGLPILEIFCLIHFTYYVNPYLEAASNFMRYSFDVRFKAGLAACLFIATVQIVFLSLMKRGVGGTAAALSFWKREVPLKVQGPLFWVLLGEWSAFNLAYTLGFLPDFGSAFGMIRGATITSGMIALFFLSMRWGEGKLSKTEKLVFLAVVVVTTLAIFTTGFLVQGAYFAVTALLAFGIGSRKVPLLAIVVCLAFINFLQLGKREVRASYWDEEGRPTRANSGPLNMYSFWFKASWRAISGERAMEGTAPEETDMFQRTSLIQMVALVIEETPDRRPFLNGETYGQVPLLLVPRILYPNKPRGSLPNETMGIYYGIQTEESVDFTAIGFGHIAEGWANFGWLGVVLAGSIFGALFVFFARISTGMPTSSIGYLIGAYAVSRTLDLENALGTFLVAMTQTLLTAGAIFYFLSRPRTSKNEASQAVPDPSSRSA